MRIKKTSSNLQQPDMPVKGTSEVILTEDQLTVNAGIVNVGTPAAGTTLSYILTNRSAAAQVIRIGFAPAFAPAAGLSLNVGESLTLNFIGSNVNAIASAPGALLDRFICTP
jgi:hypothetical protein